MHFEWDPAKSSANLRKHGLSFEVAAALLASGVDYLEIYDEEHSDAEDVLDSRGTGEIRRG